MQTRSSPSRATLDRLAGVAGIDHKHHSKPALFEQLRVRTPRGSYNRIQRLLARRVGNGKARRRANAAISADTSLSGAVQSGRKKARKELCVDVAPSSGLVHIDPITRSEILGKPFAFTRPNGSVVHLDVASIVDYLLHTGDFRDPESRLPFDDASLARLDALAADMDLGKPSVVAAKRDARRYADAREMRDGLRGVEGMLSDVCSDMMQVVEHCDGESGEMQLLMAAFPAFTELYLSLMQGDAEVARQALEHCVSFLRGPPNRPTLDPNAFLPIIDQFLQGLQQNQGSSHLAGFQ